MRVAFHTIYRQSVDSMARSLSRMTDLQQHLVTARKFLKPSEDPQGAERSLVLNKTMSQLEQLKMSTGSALLYLQSAEADLLELNGFIRQARSIAIAQRDASAEIGSRGVSATEVRSIRDQVALTLNHQVNGRYIFAGHMTDTKPFVEVNGAIQYMGDDGEIALRVAQSSLEITNIPGTDLMSFGTPSLASTALLHPAVSGATPLATLNGGLGVAAGTFEIEDELGNVLAVDTTTMNSLQDVIDFINASPTLDISASVNASGTGLELVAGNPAGSIEVRDVGGDTAASQLGILGNSVGTLTGGPLSPILHDDTPLADIAGLGALGDIVVIEDGVQTTVSFSALPAVTTVGELVTRFNQTTSDVTMRINDAGNGFELNGTAAFSVQAAGVDSTALRLGIVGNGRVAELFGSLERLEQALIAENEDGIADAIEELGQVLDGLENLEGTLGSRLQRIDAADRLIEQRELETASQLQAVVDLDMAEAISRFSEAQTVYEAALATANSVSNLNLLRFL